MATGGLGAVGPVEALVTHCSNVREIGRATGRSVQATPTQCGFMQSGQGAIGATGCLSRP